MSIKTKIYWCIVVVCLIIITFSVVNCKHKKQENEHNKIIEETKISATIEETVVEETTKTTDVVEEYTSVFTIAVVDIKKEPSVNSETIGTYDWNAEIVVSYVDDNWAKVKDAEHYVNRLFISENSIGFVDCDVPKNNTIKSYMDYRCITAVNSNQYKLQYSLAYTGDYGIRMVNGRYCVAVGSYYTTTIGQYIDIELENGNVIKGILADCKADIHTDSTNRMNPNGSVVEFVVDVNALDYTAKTMGDISYVNEWNSRVVNIKVYDKIEKY